MDGHRVPRPHRKLRHKRLPTVRSGQASQNFDGGLG